MSVKTTKVGCKNFDPGITVTGPEQYHDAMLESVEEFLNSIGFTNRTSRKKQTDLSAIVKDRMYSPTEVATILSVSYDTAWKLMPKMKGYKNIAPLGRGKRKALPRVPGWSLLHLLGRI